MLLALVACHLFVLVATNPFHKYPFVFLLDVGNEELQNTNSEQIRVSVPGGSVALRYPAIGNGNTISHVRVSGIDFGTDLKANIVDGGPGNKYVVLVFMGNPGVPYDAVITVQTVNDYSFNTQNIGGVVNTVSNVDQSEEDANNSAEDLSDAEVTNEAQSDTYIQKSNAELMQSSSNMYSYVDDESIDENDDDDDDGTGDGSDVSHEENNDSDNEEDTDQQANEETDDNNEYEGVNGDKDIHMQYKTNDIDQAGDESIHVKGIEEDDNDDDEVGNEESSSNEQQYSAKSADIDSNLYSRYVALKDHSNYGGDVYSEEGFQKGSKPDYQEDPLDYEDVDAAAPVYDDEESNNEVDKYRDSNNNNYIDSDDSYAVAY